MNNVEGYDEKGRKCDHCMHSMGKYKRVREHPGFKDEIIYLNNKKCCKCEHEVNGPWNFSYLWVWVFLGIVFLLGAVTGWLITAWYYGLL